MWQRPSGQEPVSLTAVRKPVQCPIKASDMKIRRRRQWVKTSSPYQDRVQLDISESRRRGRCTTGLRWLVWGCCTIWSFLGSPVRRCYCTEPIPPSWSSPRWLLEENRWQTFRVKAFKKEGKNTAGAAEKNRAKSTEEWSWNYSDKFSNLNFIFRSLCGCGQISQIYS